MNPKGKVAIVTGASSGIGKATAVLLSQKGARVVLAARSKDKLLKLSKTLHDSFVIVTDMSRPADIKRLITKTMIHFGRIDMLVNNAGRGYDAAVEYTDPKKFQEIFALDVVGPLIAMQQVIPIMRKQGGGAIVNISSGTALMTLPNMSPYASLKRALADISLTANMELKKDHIAVSVIYPFITKTDFEKNTLKGKEIKVAWDGGRELPAFDPPEFVAEKILEAIKTGKPELVVHEWMKKMLH
jgi:short-subunit dehydrogenase